MNKPRPPGPWRLRSGQHGYTLIELSVALMIALFLLAGFATVLQGTGKTSANQTLLAQLQDNERVAMTMMTNVIESAGYYPDATAVALDDALPVAPNFATAGQVVTGGANPSAALGDTFTVRFGTAPGDDVINCVGGSTPATGAPVVYENQFSVQTDAGGPYLGCAVNGGTLVRLVRGVQKLTIQYGVNSASTVFNSTNGAVDSYLTADQMTPVNWSNVYSVKLIVTFANPLAGQPGQPPSVVFTRVVGVMSRTGVDVANFT